MAQATLVPTKLQKVREARKNLKPFSKIRMILEQNEQLPPKQKKVLVGGGGRGISKS
jgi:hypothetical protein